MNELEKIDAIRSRMNVSYARAKEALDAADGDVTQALIRIEGNTSQGGKPPEGEQGKEESENFARGVIEQIKGIIQEGNVTKVRLKNGENVLLEIPATVGVLGLGIGVLLFSPLMLAITALGAVAVLSNEMVLEIEKNDGTVESRQLSWSQFKRGKE
ncbi:MAG: DUF4342 domain-containing protein [Clostridia bacterium]|nr:DUF4342 domain-containing protein [Clostridia bacterium]